MTAFYEKSEGVPHYITMTEESQAQAQRAKPPSSDSFLVATANQAMVAINDYPNKTKIWNKLAPSERTWAKWKPTYKEAYTASQCSVFVQSEKGTPFGGLVVNPGLGKEKHKTGVGFKEEFSPND